MLNYVKQQSLTHSTFTSIFNHTSISNISSFWLVHIECNLILIVFKWYSISSWSSDNNNVCNFDLWPTIYPVRRIRAKKHIPVYNWKNLNQVCSAVFRSLLTLAILFSYQTYWRTVTTSWHLKPLTLSRGLGSLPLMVGMRVQKTTTWATFPLITIPSPPPK